MSDQYPPPGSYPPPPQGGGDPYGNQPPQYGSQPPQYGGQPPYGEQPQYGGQPSYGEQPPQYGNQPPQYGEQQPFGAPGGAPFGAPPPAAPRRKTGKIVLIVVGILAVLGLICCGGIYFFAKDSTTNAKVGDCLKGDAIEGSGTQSVKLTIVKCTDSSARYKVVGVVEHTPKADTTRDDPQVCNAYIDKGADRVLWQGTDAADGQALCLGPAK